MATRRSNIRNAAASGGGVMMTVAIAAALLALFGVVRFGGNHFFEDPAGEYLQFPSWGVWVYIALPIAAGLAVFFFVWEDKLDDEENERRRRR